jgi:hypothetical protein
MSCPICGDSDRDKRKARGYIYTKQGKWLYHCHNCSITLSLPKFIKAVDELVYNDFIMEKMSDNRQNREPDPILNMKKPKFISDTALKELKKVSQLSNEHFCKQYVVSRQIPTTFHSRLFYSSKFMAWVNGFVPRKFDESAIKYDRAALVIPFLNREGRLHALQGRFFEGSTRYITIQLDESIPKLWGLDRYDRGNRGYVLEGPIDAMFLPNAVATAGGMDISTLKNLNLANIVIAFDNEPRSRETVEKNRKMIKSGLKVCIWPDGLPQKDVNDLILSGMSISNVKEIIDRNTFSGLRAELRLNEWKRV